MAIRKITGDLYKDALGAQRDPSVKDVKSMNVAYHKHRALRSRMMAPVDAPGSEHKNIKR